MDFSSQVSFKEMVTCPICQQLLKEPLSLGCGHSFCKACLTAKSDLEVGESNCYVCKKTYWPWEPKFNLQLAEKVDEFKEATMSSHQWQGSNICEHHEENDQIFSMKDGQSIFRPFVQVHQGQQMFLLDDVVKEYQEKLQEALTKLMQEKQEAEMLEADIEEERDTLKNQIDTETERILKGFKEMRGILEREEQSELKKLEKDKATVLNNLEVAKDQLVQQKHYMNQLISELQRHMNEFSIYRLQDMINVIRRSEIWTLKKPKVDSNKLKSTFRAPDLSGMLQKFKVDLMLNSSDTCSNVVNSEDHRQATTGQHAMFSNVHPFNFPSFNAFENQNFIRGKYHWEVDVSGKTAWILGVYSQTSHVNSRKTRGSLFNLNVDDTNVYSRFRPENGYWVIGLQNESQYIAFEDSPTSDPNILILAVAVPPDRVGVSLDYEAGTVSFFNVTDHGSLIYKFSKCYFSQTAYPYLNLWNCPFPIMQCP